MRNSKISQTELHKEIKRLEDLRRPKKEAALKAVEEMSKRPLSLEQMKAQIARNKRDAPKIRRGESINDT